MTTKFSFITLATIFSFTQLSGNDCCPPDPCCSPPCTPLQKECVDCVCFTPQYYDLQCAWGVFASVDFLYWFAKDTGLNYALTATSLTFDLTLPVTGFVSVVPQKYVSLEESWDPGFRVGIGLNGCCDGWDLYANWTYFHTKEKDKVTVASEAENEVFPLTGSIFSPWFTPTFSFLSSDQSSDMAWYNTVKAKWTINFNVVDLELGRHYWLSQCFSFRPYMGIRGGWTRERFFTTPIFRLPEGAFSGSDEITISHDVKFITQFWGVGLLGGFQPNWHFGCGFSLFGNADLSLLWGCFEIKRRESIQLVFEPPTPNTSNAPQSMGESKNDVTDMQAILDLGIGLRWESTFCCNRYRFALDLGWEQHIWFDHNHRFQLVGRYEEESPVLPSGELGFSFEDYREVYGKLVLGGIVARVRFDF